MENESEKAPTVDGVTVSYNNTDETEKTSKSINPVGEYHEQ